MKMQCDSGPRCALSFTKLRVQMSVSHAHGALSCFCTFSGFFTPVVVVRACVRTRAFAIYTESFLHILPMCAERAME